MCLHTQHISPFDAIRKVDEQTVEEYWSARDLARILGYDRWENFRRYAIPKAQKACEQSDMPSQINFVLPRS